MGYLVKSYCEAQGIYKEIKLNPEEQFQANQRLKYEDKNVKIS